MTGDAEQMLRRAGQPVTPLSALASAARFVPTPARTPFTFGYLVVLLGTTLLLKYGDPAFTDKLLTLSSTDAHNLWRRPLTSLASSALWLADEGWPIYVVIFAVAVGPLERRIGAARTAKVFFSGHVLATLATEVPIMALISAHVLPGSSGRWLDIGVSYGFFTTAGALVFLLSGRTRLLALVTMELFVALIWVSDDPLSMESVLTLLGHACAAHFGLLFWGPRLRRRERAPKPQALTTELVAVG
ncbi:rhomboid-like protein [Amycolatopsis sp. H20-H5]|uniref:rhomboid-like protein n=1 Tax=Amycolatopsis sp. H20-H5 TaxID=3046309 RepID=UPI002DBAD08C|nr:rhomboid-like protein [Amycolatopsis sp. H20-H5]MEC3975432.1 rhomboid-like protein [Amycolatopsis sp. H20-H5]